MPRAIQRTKPSNKIIEMIDKPVLQSKNNENSQKPQHNQLDQSLITKYENFMKNLDEEINNALPVPLRSPDHQI
jgi:hypothetical protein